MSRAHSEYPRSKIPGAYLELIPNAGHVLLDHEESVMHWLAERVGT